MRKASKFVALSAAAMLGLAGCAADTSTDSGASTDTGTDTTETTDTSALPAGDGQVTIYGGYGEAQAAAFQQALDEFGAANGIEITFE